jgi:hypothetical protein
VGAVIGPWRIGSSGKCAEEARETQRKKRGRERKHQSGGLAPFEQALKGGLRGPKLRDLRSARVDPSTKPRQVPPTGTKQKAEHCAGRISRQLRGSQGTIESPQEVRERGKGKGKGEGRETKSWGPARHNVIDVLPQHVNLRVDPLLHSTALLCVHRHFISELYFYPRATPGSLAILGTCMESL